MSSPSQQSNPLQTATFAGGCFWCFDAIFRKVHGVQHVRSGFAGGKGPVDYETIHADSKGYAEAVQVEFDPNQIQFSDLVDIFFHLHDPTQKNRQGYDVGTEYRSIAFYHSEEQHKEILDAIRSLELSEDIRAPIVTEVLPYTTFFEADEHHQYFYNKNKMNPYCLFIIDPKIAKLKEKYFAHTTSTPTSNAS